MSLIVEQGLGLSNSESYSSVPDTDLYHADRGNTLWATLSVAEKEQALRRATDYLQEKYRLRWKGYPVQITQALSWPRTGVLIEEGGIYGFAQVDRTIVPKEVQNACAEMAMRAASGPLMEDTSQQTLEESVGPIKVKYSEFSPRSSQYPQVENILRVYLKTSGSAMTKLVRS